MTSHYTSVSNLECDISVNLLTPPCPELAIIRESLFGLVGMIVVMLCEVGPKHKNRNVQALEKFQVWVGGQSSGLKNTGKR